MNKKILAILAIIALCSICLTGIVGAAKEGYSFNNGGPASLPTVDGAVNPATEWDDSFQDKLYNGWTMTTNIIAAKWDMSAGIAEHWLIEILTDTTSDAGDYFQISMDVAQDAAGAAPQADDFLINQTGHLAAGLKVYKGTGTGWAEFTTWAVGTDLTLATSVAASPKSATPHWIIEITFMKQAALALSYANNPRVAAYDASTAQTVMWPPYSNVNDLQTYGQGVTDMTVYPEGLTVGIMLAVSSVAVIVSTRYFKKPKINSCKPVKL